jgi:hypothetical protein
MTQYIVHLYREMRLTFTGIEADSPEAAALIVRGKLTDAADNIEDCDGQNLAALVDTAGDEDYSQSVTVDFEGERHRKAAPALLAKVQAVVELRRKWRSQDESETIDSIEYMDGLDALDLDAAIAAAEAAGIPSASAPANPTARFEIEHDPLENPDRAYVLVDGTFDVAIIRTGEGIVIDVYPKDWIDPIDTMTVWDEQVAELEHDAAAEEAGEDSALQTP